MSDEIADLQRRLAESERENHLLKEQVRQGARVRELWQSAIRQLKTTRRELMDSQAELKHSYEAQEKRLHELQRANERIEQLAYNDKLVIESMREAVVVTDAKARIIEVNPAFEKITGYSREEAIGKNPNILKSGRHDAAFYRDFWRELSNQGRWQGEIWNRRKSGDLYPVYLSIAAVRNWDGRTINYVAVSLDLHEIKQAQDQWRLAEAANQAKSEFLADMSHEIRTPMNAIIGMSRLALETDLEPGQRNYISKVHGAAQSLLGLLDETLDLAKIEAGKLEIELGDLRIRTLLDELADVIGFKAREKGLDLQISVDPAVPEVLRGDAVRLRQVLTNLAYNAVKFTDQGRIAVRVEADEGRAGRRSVHFRISDTGVGISPEQQRRLFDRFTQARGSASHNYGGSGLGLAICKGLIELMGGEIGVKSEPGEGTEFSFTLSLESGDTTEPSGHKAGDREPITRLRGSKVLLVEDNRLNHELAKELLRRQGVQVTSAWNGREALEHLQADAFDCVLMDIQMPVMDGYTATREIRAQERLRDLPVIAMTADVGVSDMEKAKEAGVNDHIGKPFLPDQLYRMVAKWILLAESAG